MRVRGALVLALTSTVALLVLPQNAAAFHCSLPTPIDRVLGCDGDASPSPASGPHPVAPMSAEPSWRGLREPQVDPTRLLAVFAAGTSDVTAARVVRDAGGTLERRIRKLGIDVVRADPAERDAVGERLRRSSHVESVSAEQILEATAVTPDDALWSQQTGMHRTRFADVWNATSGSESVVVAVVDSGVASAHADLADAVLPGVDLANGDADAADDHGHGTAVAGVIAARGNNREGIAGICWRCRILPVKVLDQRGKGASSTVAAGIVWAADHGADVVNLSLGSPATTSALREAVAYAVGRGTLVVAAAGNAGVESQFYPAAEPGALSVAATDESDRLFAWSNYGQWVHVAAPGCLPTTTRTGDYAVQCGTSFAAPVVSGLAALALAARPTVTAAEVADAIRRGALTIGSSVHDGRVDAVTTFSLLPPLAPIIRTVVARSDRDVVVQTERGTLTATLTSARRSRFTLTLAGPGGAVVARAQGRSPLRLSSSVEAGTYRIRTTGVGARGAFSLSIAYPSAP